jgi:hypothetical protein
MSNVSAKRVPLLDDRTPVVSTWTATGAAKLGGSKADAEGEGGERPLFGEHPVSASDAVDGYPSTREPSSC